MELNYDWKNFQKLFDSPVNQTDETHYLLEDQGKVVAGYSSQDDLSGLTGNSRQDTVAMLAEKKVVVFQQKDIDRWMNEAVSLPHYYEQFEFLRSKTSIITQTPSQSHFFLKAIKGWWNRFLPNQFAIYLSLSKSSEPHQHFVLIFKKGILENFHAPNLTSLMNYERKKFEDAISYLQEKHAMPVQGVAMNLDLWNQLSQTAHPWKQVAKHIFGQKINLNPPRWGLFVLIAVQALIEWKKSPVALRSKT